MAEKYWRRLLTVSWKGDTVWDGSFAANFARRHFSFRIGHAGPNRNPPFRPHGSPWESLLNTKNRAAISVIGQSQTNVRTELDPADQTPR